MRKSPLTHAQGGAAFLAYQRYKAGTSSAFSAGLGDEDGGCPEGTYTAYDEGENGGTGQYSEPPFAGGAGGGGSAGANTDALLVLPGRQSKDISYFLWPLASLGCHDSR